MECEQMHKNKTGRFAALLAALFLALCAGAAGGCAAACGSAAWEREDMEQGEVSIQLSVDGVVLPVLWEENEAVDGLAALLEQGDVTVQTQRYGGFEQVGPLPSSLPRAEAQTTAVPGDIMLDGDDQIVFFFGSNTWAYTRLGHIDLAEEALASLLGAENAAVTLSRVDGESIPEGPTA